MHLLGSIERPDCHTPPSSVIFAALLGTVVAACTFDTRIAQPIEIDADVPDGPPPEPTLHLLLSEIKTSNDLLLREFIEVLNPTDAAISLADYYLTDTSLYARLPSIIAGEAVFVDDGDFVVRFPSSAIIEPGGVVTIATRTTAQRPFEIADFAIEPAGGNAAMLPAFTGSIPPGPNLRNDDGEGISLFFWDQSSDLVTDIDSFIAGYVVFDGNELANKSGLTLDGPDPDADPTSYATDAYTMPTPLRSNGINQAFVRVSLEVGETQTGGNGINGHDETTENTLLTWGLAAETPGVPPDL